jgi:hypothetical protein
VSNEALALGITLLIHVIGICFLFGLMLRSDDAGGGGWRDWWPRDDDGPGGWDPDPGPPMPSADPSRVRLREPGRIADATRPPARRPEHAPQRVPGRERV